jgi:hypothetical protein
MAGGKWVLLATAAALIGTSDAPRRIQRAWMLGTARLRGVRNPGVHSDGPRRTEPVEIPAGDAASLGLDCARSRVIPGERARWRVTIYESVEVRLADAKRLAREAKEAITRSSPEAMHEATPAPHARETLKPGPASSSDRFAGRPSLKQAMLAELQNRIKERLECDTLAAEAHYLFEWVRTQYPGDRHLPGGEKSLQNTIRIDYRALRADRDKSTK